MTEAAVPAPTQIPLPTFRVGKNLDATSSDLLDFLRTLVSQAKGCDELGRTVRLDRGGWMATIDGLSEHILASFPVPNSVPWNALLEKTSLCDASLEVIECAAICEDHLFQDSDERSVLVLFRVLSFLITVGLWSNSSTSERYRSNSPQILRRKACATVEAILSAFIKSTPSNSRTCRMLLLNSLETVRGASSGVTVLKLTIHQKSCKQIFSRRMRRRYGQ